jgi:hypothetical protein
MNASIAMRLILGGLVAASVVFLLPQPADAESAVELAAHRAIYDLKLADARGKRPIRSVRGRILYDFSGNACEGYALQFRQVSELDSGEGRAALSDLRATTWEEGEAKSFRFNSQSFTNERTTDGVDGRAERAGAGTKVALTKPARKSYDIEAKLSFPTQHMREIIEAARAGKTVFETPVYDGSETGEKIYETLTVIGRPIEAGASKPTDAAGAEAALANMRRWPVRISYFDRAKSGGESTPVYAISFELYDNGISRHLLLDYNDFTISGEITSLEIRAQTPCK